MKKLSSQMAAMVTAFINGMPALHDKLKAECHSVYGFFAEKGNFITFLTPKRLAEQLDVSLKTLERARKDGSGPPFKKVGKQIRYPIAALDAWVRDGLMNKEASEDNAENSDDQ